MHTTAGKKKRQLLSKDCKRILIHNRAHRTSLTVCLYRYNDEISINPTIKKLSPARTYLHAHSYKNTIGQLSCCNFSSSWPLQTSSISFSCQCKMGTHINSLQNDQQPKIEHKIYSYKQTNNWAEKNTDSVHDGNCIVRLDMFHTRLISPAGKRNKQLQQKTPTSYVFNT